MKFELILLFLKTVVIVAKGSQEKNFAYCESYNSATCNKLNKKDCYVKEKCGPITADRHNHCFTLWARNSDTGVSKVQMKGCFLNNKNCYGGSHCTEKTKQGANQFYFCCCNGQMCNQNITYENMVIKKEINVIPPPDMEFRVYFTHSQFQVLIPMFVTLFFSIAIGIFISFLYCQRKKSRKIEISKAELGQSFVLPKVVARSSFLELQHVNETSYQSDMQLSDISLLDTELIEKKASGRFGDIWKARRNNGETVAVKVIPLRERKSWYTELNVFRIPEIEHENLLRFIGACRVGDRLEAEYWLLTDYCDNGSLYDHLREKTVTRDELLDIALSIASGLKHLHREHRDPTTGNYKPAIAHRDLKTKNVLLKTTNPIRICIADFNLSLMIQDGGRSISHCARVGTLRYMAPEVLNGAINFRKDHILAIDMYGYALVLWELMSRCIIDEDPVDDYQIPFQSEVGLTPTLAEMHDCVVHKKRRPQLKESWKHHSDFELICETIEECWDHDPDARISSSTVLERIIKLQLPLEKTS